MMMFLATAANHVMQKGLTVNHQCDAPSVTLSPMLVYIKLYTVMTELYLLNTFLSIHSEFIYLFLEACFVFKVS